MRPRNLSRKFFRRLLSGMTTSGAVDADKGIVDCKEDGQFIPVYFWFMWNWNELIGEFNRICRVE